MSKKQIDPLVRIADSLDSLCATLEDLIKEAKRQYEEDKEK